METIHKTRLIHQHEQIVRMPYPVEILDIQYQNDVPTIWYKFDMDYKHEKDYKINMFATGQGINGNFRYISTVQKDGFVWHFHLNLNPDEQNK